MVEDEILPSDTKIESPVLASPEVRDRVTVGPAESWIIEREVDESFRLAATNSYMLLDRQFNATGNKHYERRVQRLETGLAVHAYSQWRLDFNPRTDRVVIHSLAIIRNGNRMEHALPDRFRFLQREAGLEHLVIDGTITVVVLMENVQQDDIIDVSYTVESAKIFLTERAWYQTYIPTNLALRAFYVTVRFTPDRSMRWKSNDDKLAPAIREADGETEWTWKVENLRPLSQEPGVPSWQSQAKWIQVSDFQSWAEISSGLASAWGDYSTDPVLLQFVEEINASAATPAERAGRALTMVQDDIRYLSFNTDLGGHIPSPPGTVLTRRYGDCKDKSFLLSHILRLLGFNAQPVLVNTVIRKSVEQFLPMPTAFDHAVVEYEIDGKKCWADATMTMQGGDALNRLMQYFKIGLPIRQEMGDLQAIQPVMPANYRYELRESFNFDSRQGRCTTLQVTIKAHGWDAERLRHNIAHEGKERVAEKRLQFYKRFFPGIRRFNTLQWHDDRERNEFILAEIYEIPDALVAARDGTTCIFQYRAHLVDIILAYPQMGKRKHPYMLRYPCNVEHCIEWTTSAIKGKQMPRVVKSGHTFTFFRESSKSGNKSVVRFTVQTLTGVLSPEQFETHKKDVNKVASEILFNIRMPIGIAPLQRKPADDANLLPIHHARGPVSDQNNLKKSAEPTTPAPVVNRNEFFKRISSKHDVSTAPKQTEEDTGGKPEMNGDEYGSRRRKTKRASKPYAGLQSKKILIGAIISVVAIAWVVLIWLLVKN